jgi:outer membrane receptor for ferric coprogen and ferric-rhodotorulic acid
MSTHSVFNALRLPFRLRALSLAIAGTAAALPAHAQTQTTAELRDYDVPAGPLKIALNRIAREGGVALSVESSLVEGKRSAAVRGHFDAVSALRAALNGTGLELAGIGTGMLSVQAAPRTGETTLRKVNVTAAASPLDTPPETHGLKADYQSSSSKLPLSIRETPQSVTVITQQSLRDRQVTDLGQALELSAGVNQFSGTGPFGGQSSFGLNEMTIRGITIDGYNDVREDGFLNNAYFDIPDMAIYDRVEVVKGANAVTYGRGSVGGIINRVRKKPLAEAQTDLEVSVGSYDTYRLDLDTTGPLTASGNVRGRLVAAYDDEGSFVDGVHSKRTVLAPSIDVDLGTSTRLLAEGLIQVDRFTPNSGFPLVARGDGSYRAPHISRSTFVGEPTDDGDHESIYSGSVQIDQDLNDRWLATLRLSGSKTSNKMKDDRYAYGFDAGYTAMNKSKFDIGNTIWAGELRFSGSVDVGGRDLALAAGAEFSHNDYHRRGSYVYPYLGVVNIYAGNFNDPPSQPFSYTYESGGTDKNTGYFAQAQIRPIDRLSVLLGLRYDRTDSELHSQTSGNSQQKKDEAVTGRIGLTYDFTSHVSGYTLYGQSFLPQLFSVDKEGNILDPETGEIYEAGLKTEWLDGRLGINTAVYRIDREHIPVSVATPPGVPQYSISSGLQRSDGAELEINGEPLPGWQLSMAYNVLNSDYKDRDDPLYGTKPGGSADWQYAMFTSYELQSGMLQGAGAGFTFFATPERGLPYSDGGTLDGYQRTDLHLFYKGLRNLEFRLTMRNLFDARYVEGADRIGAYAQFGSPRAALLSVHYTPQGKSHN